jgi:cytochrome c oxidase assembly protein subunit 15
VPYNPWHHRIAVFIAVVTFFVIIAGALVTSEDAGLSVPDWPTSYGHFVRLPPWVGGIVFEHSHRMIAFFTGTCTLVIAVWTLVVERRRWMKILGLGALATIILQGILGGVTVLHFLPPAVSTAHAAIAQTFFCIAVAIAVFTGRRWVEESPRLVVDNGHPKLLVLCFYSIFILYVQLILGAMFRHRGMPWWPHVVNAVSVTVILAWAGVRAMRFREIPPVRRLGMLVHSLLLVQILLGFASFYTRIVEGADAPQPELPMIVSTVAHVSVGALLLATTAVLTIQVWRHVTVQQTQAAIERTTITA